MPLFRGPTGLILLGPGGLPAGTKSCCCGPTISECCCPQFVDPLPDMTFTLSGYLSGSVVAPGQLLECGQWDAQIPLDFDICDFTLEVQSIMTCPVDNDGTVSSIEVQLIGGGGACALSIGPQLEGDCGPPFHVRYQYTVIDVGGCPCIGETGFLDIDQA